jgi:site-specific DNA-methyltransferase (adenine-specific)
MARAQGTIRDAIVSYLAKKEVASVAEIRQAVAEQLGEVPSSSVRSYLNLNVPAVFERTGRARYRLKKKPSDRRGK